MAINIVVLDYVGLPADADFPPLRATRYRWEQYPSTPAALIAERGGSRPRARDAQYAAA